MGCSSCGGKIRRLAQQYQYKSVEPVPKEVIAEKKARLTAALKFSVIVEEIDSEFTEKIDDASVIHTE